MIGVAKRSNDQQALSGQNGVFMKIILIGANGKIGELVQKALAGAGHEIVKVGRKSGDFRVEIENRESVRKLYQAVGSFDAVAIAAGEVAFAPLSELTAEKWQFSLGSKLMGQISLVQEAIPFIKENGSFTLVSGVLNDEPIFAGVAASTVSGALEGFVRATAIELPKGLRINLVNPTMLEESVPSMGSFFHGVIPVEGWKVAQAYKRAILGAQTGRVYRVD
jgi:NAD(P)-dependent dehydrogenase (short-subunit alcohol dehydrogenase family)